MALKVILLRRQVDGKKKALEALRAKDGEFLTREAELEQAISEVEPGDSEQEAAVGEAVEKFEADKKTHEESKQTLSADIERLEGEIEELERGCPPPGAPKDKNDKKARGDNMSRKTFFGMSIQERDAFLARDEVKEFLSRTRDMAAQKRTISGVDLTIPTAVLELIRQNIEDYSKLVRRVRLRSVSGKVRQNIMGALPEAVWTEACAALNELTFGFSQVEVDGYKVGGIIYICVAMLEDSDLNLASEIINALGAAIGLALDKAILYGTGVKMPLGIVTRLNQQEQPANYPAAARPWTDLHEKNLITITGKNGIALFQELAKASKVIRGKYARGGKFWVMNESTFTDLQVEAMSINAAGAIVSGQTMTMPVVGGDVVLLSDDIVKDGNIVVGYGDLYLLAERAGAAFARSDEYRFAEDQVAFKGTARYDGAPVIPEGFAAIGIGAAPATDATFPGDTANDTTLADLTIGGTQVASFDPETLTYSQQAAGAAVAINASPTQSRARVTLVYKDKNYPNGSTIKLEQDNKLLVVVANGISQRTYTVSLTAGE